MQYFSQSLTHKVLIWGDFNPYQERNAGGAGAEIPVDQVEAGELTNID